MMRTAWLAVVVFSVSCRPAVDPVNASLFDEDDPAALPVEVRVPEPEPELELEPEFEPVKVGWIDRTTLDQFLDRGVGAFLASLEVEPHLANERFVGWKLIRIEPSWLDIRAGDVVTAINHQRIERPAQFQKVWEALRATDDIVISGRRDGTAFELHIAVSGDQVAPAEPAPIQGGGTPDAPAP